MALSDENGGMVMPVQPMGGGYGYGMPYGVPMMGYNNGGGFGFGGDGSWLAILFLFAIFGGGFGGFGGGFGGFGGYDFPWLLNGQQNILNGVNANTNAGFNQAATASALGDLSTAVTSGFGNVQNSLCSGFAGVNATVNGAQNAVSQQLYTNEIASLNRSFAEQAANTAAINGVQSQLADCCCENRLATANLGALVQSENCADREALSNGIRDIISAQTAGTQRILDMMCQDKIDAKNEKIAELQQQVALQNLAASQNAQTAALTADNAAQTQYIVNRVAPYPVPAYPVSNPFGCNCGNGVPYYGFNNFGTGFNPFGNVGFGNGSF